MSYFEDQVEVITGGGGRRDWPAAEKLRAVEENFERREMVSSVVRRNGVAPNMLFRCRKLVDAGVIAQVRQVVDRRPMLPLPASDQPR
ncbi:MAG: transposase [Alphaproteobacteria bacterium]|jgi:transposase-like protein